MFDIPQIGSKIQNFALANVSSRTLEFVNPVTFLCTKLGTCKMCSLPKQQKIYQQNLMMVTLGLHNYTCT